MNKNLIPEESLTDLCEALTALTGGEKREISGSIITYKPNVQGISWYHRGCLKKAPFGKAAETIGNASEAIKKAAEEKMPLICYTKENPETYPSSLLKQAGYEFFLTQTGMILPLEDMEVPKDDPHAVRIGKEQLAEWTRVYLECFGKPEEAGFEYLIGHERCHFYAYMVEGKIAGTTLLYLNKNNAGIHEVGVLPEYRGKGMAGKLVAGALRDAADFGAKLASLQASDMGEPLYLSMGFQAVSKIETWKRID